MQLLNEIKVDFIATITGVTIGDKSGDYTFIADSKLVNKKNLEVIYADESPIMFISRCPSIFSSKIAEKTRKEAYLLDNWEDIGICCENEKSKRAARYKAQSFVKPVHGNMLRLIVIKGNDPENKVIKYICLLYTSDAADDLTRVDLGG